MDSCYGINVKNKFDLFYDEDLDPLEILAQQETAKKAEAEKKKKEEKGKKTKNAKKPVLKTENKNKVQEEIKPEREEKQNAPRQQSERPRTGRNVRENNFSKEPREDNRPPRRREENQNQENRDRPERFDGGFGRPERSEGGGFPREGGPRDGNFRGRGRGRGGRGGGGRGRGGVPTERGGFGGKRDFDRHSGSDRTGVKATEKREGGGSHNWGTVKDDIEEQLKETVEEPQEWNQQNEDTENKDPNESTESANPEETEEDQPKQLTLEEWKKMEEQKRVKSTFKLRKAGEGVDSGQWKTGRVYRKSAGDDESDEEDEEDEDEDEARSKRFVNEIKITFNDSPRRGRGGRRPRGPRGGRATGRGGDRRGGSNSAPKFEDENEFPSLIKTAA